MNRFKKEFVKELITKIPKIVIDKFPITFKSVVVGYIRIENSAIHSVYLGTSITHNNDSGVKFDFKESQWVFGGLYVCKDGFNEHRYDEKLQINATYLKGIAIDKMLNIKTKQHYVDVLNDWRNLVDKKKLYVIGFQVIKNSEFVKVPYIFHNHAIDALGDELDNKIKEITDYYNQYEHPFFKVEKDNKQIYYLMFDPFHPKIPNYDK